MKDIDSPPVIVCLDLQNWFSRVRRTCCAMPGSVSGFPWGVRNWCSSRISDTAEEILANTSLGKNPEMQQSNLISSVTKGQSPFVSLKGLGDPAAGKLGSWDLYIPGISGCYHWWIFLHAYERKERDNSHRLTLETFRSGVPVMPERSAWLVNTSTIPIFLRVSLIS